MKLVAGGAVERTPLIGADLRRDTEPTQERECSTRDGGVRDVEMDRDLPAPAQVHAAGRVEEPGQLGEPVTLAARGDRGELAAQILRE